MKKLLPIICFVLVTVMLMASGYANEPFRTQQQIYAHEIAESARAMGLPEDSTIIKAAQELWWEDYGHEEEIRIISRVIYNEAGCCTEEHQLSVGATLLNRTSTKGFDDNIYDCVVHPGQYHPGYAEYNNRYNIPTDRIVEFESLARRVLNGEPENFPDDVVWQANFKQGKVYKVFYSDVCNSYTYFCYK